MHNRLVAASFSAGGETKPVGVGVGLGLGGGGDLFQCSDRGCC